MGLPFDEEEEDAEVAGEEDLSSAVATTEDDISGVPSGVEVGE